MRCAQKALSGSTLSPGVRAAEIGAKTADCSLIAGEAFDCASAKIARVWLLIWFPRLRLASMS
jgi:hypothetical protein